MHVPGADRADLAVPHTKNDEHVPASKVGADGDETFLGLGMHGIRRNIGIEQEDTLDRDPRYAVLGAFGGVAMVPVEFKVEVHLMYVRLCVRSRGVSGVTPLMNCFG